MQAQLKSMLDRPGHTRWRKAKDRLASWCFAVGGVSVIGAVLLILFYLLWEVLPLLRGAEIGDARPVAAGTQLVWLDTDEQETLLASLDRTGRFGFFNLETSTPLQVTASLGETVSSLSVNAAQGQRMAIALEDGSIRIVEVEYRIRFEGRTRVVEPLVSYPYGEAALDVAAAGPARHLSFSDQDTGLTLARVVAGVGIIVDRFGKSENLLTGAVTLDGQSWTLPAIAEDVVALEISGDQRWLFVAGQAGVVQFYRLGDSEPQLLSQATLIDAEITTSTMLSGGVSLLLGNAEGMVTQLFPVRNEQNRYELKLVRQFKVSDAAIRLLVAEDRRKAFAAFDAQGRVALLHATAHRELLMEPVGDGAPDVARISPRASALLASYTTEGTRLWNLRNEHPEISWSGIWGRVWYENYAEPRFIWQSSAANNDFESKFSLTPLAFGTLKAAFYAMLVAVPLALAGALFTAYFMAPKMRQTVKPTIEIMEALPTVILGFLAGLWLAPLVEKELASFFAVLFILAPGIVLFGWGWSRLPSRFRGAVHGGWQALVLLPVVIVLAAVGWSLGDPIQNLFFGGDLRQWMTTEMGITYDQRNAMVVGIAMGFAVIPTIFSIAEDAIFSVPKSLSQGSLALGATAWQTAIRVVLPTASPGIFSALMIGMGRAVGETMIVLMATGNTPIMDFNLFEGMRTLAANIAVEMPESAVGSTHYRVLFAAALVLFGFTFVVNTVAEVVRQRLRERYSSL